jgi:hypothetical protein
MTAPLPARFKHETVKVQDFRRGGGMGGGLQAPRSVSAAVVDEQTMVRAADGSEVLSNTQVHVAFDEDIQLQSLVTVWEGQPGSRTAQVLAISRFRHDRLPSFQTLHLK